MCREPIDLKSWSQAPERITRSPHDLECAIKIWDFAIAQLAHKHNMELMELLIAPLDHLMI